MKTTALLGLLSCFVIVPAANANLVTNGDFEDPPISDVASGFRTYFGGQSFTGWTVGGSSVDVVGDNPASWVWWRAASGHQSLDLNGNGPGSVSQDIPTVAGQSYALSFALAANAINAPPVVTMEFLWHDQVVDTLSFNTQSDRNDPGWTYFSYVVTAATDLARLTFGSLVFSDTAGAAIDDVVVNPLAQSHSVTDSATPWLSLIILLPAGLHWVGRRFRFQVAER